MRKKVISKNGKEHNIKMRKIGNGRVSIDSDATDYTVACNEEDGEKEFIEFVNEIKSGICD